MGYDHPMAYELDAILVMGVFHDDVSGVADIQPPANFGNLSSPNNRLFHTHLPM